MPINVINNPTTISLLILSLKKKIDNNATIIIGRICVSNITKVILLEYLIAVR